LRRKGRVFGSFSHFKIAHNSEEAGLKPGTYTIRAYFCVSFLARMRFRASILSMTGARLDGNFRYGEVSGVPAQTRF